MNKENQLLSKINPAQQKRVVSETNSWLAKAEVIVKITIAPIDVLFDLKGRTSGMFCTRGKRCWIRYNPWIFARHFDDSLAITVPHEVAHYVCFLLYGRNHRPHGKEWKALMNQFGVQANATCKLDLSDIPQRRIKRFTYQCDCQTHELSSIRHNRIVRGLANYSCQKCGAGLKVVEPV